MIGNRILVMRFVLELKLRKNISGNRIEKLSAVTEEKISRQLLYFDPRKLRAEQYKLFLID